MLIKRFEQEIGVNTVEKYNLFGNNDSNQQLNKKYLHYKDSKKVIVDMYGRLVDKKIKLTLRTILI